MSLEPGRIAFILVALVFLGWFALGTHVNVRQGERLLRWLRDGMTLLGQKTTLRWLGSSAIELKVQHAVGPLASAEVFIVLEPRDVPLLWWVFRARGRRDLLIVRGQLRAAPRRELEALDTRAWSTRGIERAVQRDHWTPVTLPSGTPLVGYAPAGTTALAEMLPLVTLPELSLVRLAVRRGAPHLEVQWRLAGFERLASRRVFEALHQVAERV